MKKLLYINLLLALVIPLYANAQDSLVSKGYSGGFEFYVGPGRNIVYRNPFEIGFQTFHGYRFSPLFSLHLGIGIQTDNLFPIALPIHLDARFDLGKNGLRPFVQAGAGYGIPLGYEFGGANAQLALGIRYPMGSRLGGTVSLAGRLQRHSEDVYGPLMVTSRYIEFRLGLAFGS